MRCAYPAVAWSKTVSAVLKAITEAIALQEFAVFIVTLSTLRRKSELCRVDKQSASTNCARCALPILLLPGVKQLQLF
jgi:hypothetical protein